MTQTNSNFNEAFAFMLQENDKAYQMIERHFDSAEKSTTSYLVIIAAVVSINGYLQKEKEFSIFQLTDFQILCAFFITIIGTIILLKVIEHRLIIISYTKTLNLNRNWFVDNLSTIELKKYLFWAPKVNQPQYYRPFKHFFWELMGLATINSPFLSICVVNLFMRFNFNSKHAKIINWVSFISISVVSVLLMMFIYKIKAEKEEKKVFERISKGEITN
jgi:hypothetical protein